MRFARSVRGVAVGLLQLIRFGRLQELEEALGSGTIFAVLQEHRVLTDRLIVLGRDDPAGAGRDLAVLIDLGQGDKPTSALPVFTNWKVLPMLLPVTNFG